MVGKAPSGSDDRSAKFEVDQIGLEPRKSTRAAHTVSGNVYNMMGHYSQETRQDKSTSSVTEGRLELSDKNIIPHHASFVTVKRAAAKLSVVCRRNAVCGLYFGRETAPVRPPINS